MRNATIQRVLFCLLGAGFALSSIGCQGHVGGLTLTSVDKNSDAQHKQNFSNCYVSKNDAGDTDIVLIDDATQRCISGEAAGESTRQIMHVRMLWQPTRDMKANEPANSNASIHWYVFPCDKASLAKGNMIEYSGSAWVDITDLKELLRISIENATLKPKIVRGMDDPVGRAKVEGSVFAHYDTEKVTQLLADIHSSTGGASVSSAAAAPGN